MYITLIQCNGLESNEKFFEKKKLSQKTFLSKKNALKKNQIQFFWKFSEVQIFSKVQVKNNEFRI